MILLYFYRICRHTQNRSVYMRWAAELLILTKCWPSLWTGLSSPFPLTFSLTLPLYLPLSSINIRSNFVNKLTLCDAHTHIIFFSLLFWGLTPIGYCICKRTDYYFCFISIRRKKYPTQTQTEISTVFDSFIRSFIRLFCACNMMLTQKLFKYRSRSAFFRLIKLRI